MLERLDKGDVKLGKSEQSVLASYLGWGGIPEAFFKPNGSVAKGWDREAIQLKEVLSSENYSSALRSVLNSHYTDFNVAKAMWRAVQEMGFKGGKILEPSAGIGTFLGCMPTGLYGNSNIYAVELDHISSRILTNLYSNVRVFNQGYEDSKNFDPEQGTYDLVIGNPPFGNEKIVDDFHRDISGNSIHNYFVLKSIKALKPNGVVAFVISKFFMDAKDTSLRAEVAKDCEFLGGIRLPDTAFVNSANTSVTSDIIFLRKWEEEVSLSRKSANYNAWVGVEQILDTKEGREDNYLTINSYFKQSPEMMLGLFGSYGQFFAGETTGLIEDEGQNTLELLDEAVDRLPKDFMFKNIRVDLSEASFPMDYKIAEACCYTG